MNAIDTEVDRTTSIDPFDDAENNKTKEKNERTQAIYGCMCHDLSRYYVLSTT